MANNILAQPGASRGPSTFNPFPKLPPELRFMIWEEAFLTIAKEMPRDWELTLRDSEDGGAVVVESDRKDTPATRGPDRDLYIQHIRLASPEANYVFETNCLQKVFTPATCLANPEFRYTIGLPPLKVVWLCPEFDQWMFNFEFNSLGDDLVFALPIFEDWIAELVEFGNANVLHDSLEVLKSIRHLRVGFRALSEYTEHNIDEFLEWLPELERISIYLEQIPPNQVPDRYEAMVDMSQGGDFSYENRHAAAYCFFQELRGVHFHGGRIRTVPKSATKDIVVPNNDVLASRHYRSLRSAVREDLLHAMKSGLNRQDMLSFINRWEALGERGIERVMVTRITAKEKHFGRRAPWHSVPGYGMFVSPRSLLQPSYESAFGPYST
ncbi:hypothetical protein PG985_000511 [Apiospora marii]|uniref:2EXR domain-containing protein n=1 Tax=Apiospora marii TaxID=335849 RepID=A0ABR1R2G8_9PEZI